MEVEYDSHAKKNRNRPRKRVETQLTRSEKLIGPN